MKLLTTGRIIGSFLLVTAYFIVLHVSATLGAAMHLIANIISIPFFIRTKAHDVVIMLTFLIIISLTKLTTIGGLLTWLIYKNSTPTSL